MERIIKRYRNRKLYDTHESRYISLEDIETMLQADDTVNLLVIDNKTGEDITRQILVQIILLREKQPGSKALPLNGLKSMITQSGHSLKKFFQKTFDLGKFDFEQLKQQIEKIGEWISHFLNERLKRGLLQIPTRTDWKRIESKLTLLEANVDKLAAGMEE